MFIQRTLGDESFWFNFKKKKFFISSILSSLHFYKMDGLFFEMIFSPSNSKSFVDFSFDIKALLRIERDRRIDLCMNIFH